MDNPDLKNILKVINKKNYLTYGFDERSNYQILNPKYTTTNSKFDLKISGHGSKKIILKNLVINLIGEHNVLNATAATVVCLNLGISIKIVKKVLKNFSGVQRRLTKIFIKNRNQGLQLTKKSKFDYFLSAHSLYFEKISKAQMMWHK